MVTVEIVYCVPCGLLDPAIRTERDLLEAFGREIDGVRLTTGHGGVFRVAIDGETVYDKDDQGGEIDVDAIRDAVDDRIATEA